jgi:hypothetical protein
MLIDQALGLGIDSFPRGVVKLEARRWGLSSKDSGKNER